MIADYHELRATTYDDDGCRWWKKNEEVVRSGRWPRGRRGGMKACCGGALLLFGWPRSSAEMHEGTSTRLQIWREK